MGNIVNIFIDRDFIRCIFTTLMGFSNMCRYVNTRLESMEYKRGLELKTKQSRRVFKLEPRTYPGNIIS